MAKKKQSKPIRAGGPGRRPKRFPTASTVSVIRKAAETWRPRVIHVFAIQFRRALRGPWEGGVMVGDLIVDAFSKPVREPVGDWRETLDEGCMWVNVETPAQKGERG